MALPSMRVLYVYMILTSMWPVGMVEGDTCCRSVQLQTSEVPSASELFDTGMGILRSIPDLLPCNRIAISTNTFQPLPGSGGGALDQMFSAPRQKPKPKAAGGGVVGGSLPSKAVPASAKQSPNVMSSLAKQAQATPVQKSGTQAHVICAGGRGVPASACSTGVAHSLPQPSQPVQSSKRSWLEHASPPQPKKVVAGAGGWVHRKQFRACSAVPQDVGASALLSTTQYGNTQARTAPSMGTLQHDGQDAGGAGEGPSQ